MCCQESPLIFIFCLKFVIYHPQIFIAFLQCINNTHKLSSSIFLIITTHTGGSEVEASACNAGDLGSIPGSGRSPQEGNGNPLQYSCLENPMDWRAWWATVHGVAKSWTRLCDFTFTFKPLQCLRYCAHYWISFHPISHSSLSQLYCYIIPAAVSIPATTRDEVLLSMWPVSDFVLEFHIWDYFLGLLGFPGGSDGKESDCSVGYPGSILGLGRPLEKEMATHSNILAWKSHGWRSLAGYSPRDHKKSATTEQLHFS